MTPEEVEKRKKRKRFRHSLYCLIASLIVVGYLIVTPQQKYLNYRVGGKMNQSYEANFYQLRGLYNTLQGHNYRVDYLNANHHVIGKQYFAKRNQVPKSDIGGYIGPMPWRYGS